MDFTLRWLMVLLLYFLIGTRHSISALTTKYAGCRSWPFNSTVEIQVDATYTSDSSGILKTSYSGAYEGNLNCKIVLKPRLFDGIILSIRKLDFRLGCRDKITIRDSNGFLLETYCTDKYDSMEFTSHYSSGEMTIIFETASGYVSSLYSGFELVYTAYSSTPCTSSEFKCPRGCIWKYLKCDGHNHCGDRSDQLNCDTFVTSDYNVVISSEYSTINVGRVVGIVFGSVFLLIASVAGAIYYRKQRYLVTVGNVVHNPPPQQPYVAQYPAPGIYPGSLYPQQGQMNYPPPQQGQMNYPPPQQGQMNYPPPQYSPSKEQQTGHDNAGFQ